jgi:hypothetical protein
VNAERLHAVAIELRDDLAATEVPALLQQLSTQLVALAANPADAAAAQNAASTREQLRERLTSSRVNQFSDSWRLALEELGIWDIVGDQLRNQLEDIFTRHEITPSTASTEVEGLNSRVQQLNNNTTELIRAFDSLGIGAEVLAQGDFEIGFLIPRAAVGNVLNQLGAEFEKLDKIIKPFEELAGEGTPDLEVRSISSSGFMVFLAAAPDLALTLSKIVESLLASYEKIRGIREKASALEKDDDVPPEVTEGLINHANERMDIDIEALTNEIVGQSVAKLPEGRPHELQIAVRHSLRQLATRIDEGYSIEVRAFVPPEGEEPVEGIGEDVIHAAREITERQPRMRAMNLTGRPILELEEGDDEEEDSPSSETGAEETPAEGEATSEPEVEEE